jgi:hypothetical protein
MEIEKITEGLQMLREALTAIGTPRLIVKEESFEEFVKIWLVKETIDEAPLYNGVKLPSMNLSVTKLYIRKGLGVNKVIFVARERLNTSGLKVLVSRVYTKEYYDDVCDVLVSDGIPIAIDLDTE